MSVDLLYTLLLLALGVVLIMQGLPGLFSGKLYVRGRYSGGTHYSGNKAIAIGFGMVAFGVLLSVSGISIVAAQSTSRLPVFALGLFGGIGIYLISWIISWFVSGTAVRERGKSWWS